MKVAVIRWLLFIFVGLPLHWVFTALYIPIFLIWRLLFVRMPQKYFDPRMFDKDYNKKEYYEEPVFLIDYGFLHNSDDHNMFTQFTVATENSFKYFTYRDQDGFLNFTRTPRFNTRPNMFEVSGDCVISFCFAAVVGGRYKIFSKELKPLVLDLAKTYLTFLGTRSFDAVNHGTVSARCNNFGVNWCPDGYLQLGQPSFGPNYFTSAALFALAGYYSKFYKIVYWVHWFLMLGFVYELMPLIVPKKSMYYVRDMTAKAIWIIKILHNKPKWADNALQLIDKTIPFYNILLEALMGNTDFNYEDVSEELPRFFSQVGPYDSIADNVHVPQLPTTLKIIAKQHSAIVR